MSKRFVDPALSGPLCLVLLIWQLSVPALAQAQTQSALDSKGTMLSHRIEGERAVRLAMEILRGNLPPKPLTILPAPMFPMFDWQQLERWGLNESALPADTCRKP
jgi:hypothetical protein